MLHFNGLEPIDFKGKRCEPTLDTEKRMRLQRIKIDTEAEIEKAQDVLCACFKDEYAKNFIRKKLSPQDLQVLAVYLTGGETGLNNFSRATDSAVEKYIERSAEGLNV